MIETLFVGIDVGKTVNTVRLLDPYGSTLKLFTVPNDKPGAEKLRDSLKDTLLHADFDSVTIGMESTSIYADHLALFLRNDDFLRKWNVKVHILNAKQTANFRKAYISLPKTDNIDTLVIADFLRFGRITKEVIFDEKCIALRNLTRARFQAAQNLSREKARFLDTLFYKFSNLDTSKVFSNTFGATSLAVITEFMSTDDINNTPLDELTAFIREKGKNHFADPEEVAKALQAAARGSYRLGKVANNSINQLLSVRVAAIRAIEQQIDNLDSAIADYMVLFPNTLTSVPGIGFVYSAGIIAEIGDINRFPNHAALAKYSGLVWRKHQSSSYEAENTPMVVSGNKYLRYYLIEAANKVRMHDTTFKRYYHLKYAEVTKHKHKRALALTARKLVRLVYSLLNTSRLYTEPTE